MEKTTGKLNKKNLVSYVQYRCDRQLFLLLGENNDKWITPLRPVQKQSRPMIETDFLTTLGHDYEQKVYKALLKLPSVICKQESERNIDKISLSSTLFSSYYHKLSSQQENIMVLLEHEISVSQSFLDFLFPRKTNNNEQEDENKKKERSDLGLDISNLRPDIMILKRYEDNYHTPKYELLPNGELVELSQRDLQERFGISIIDIKTTEEEDIGKKQFIEILYYLFNLSHFIYENQLNSQFFISIENNGIFPHRERLEFPDFDSFFEMIVPLQYSASNRIYFQVHNKIQELWQKIPCSIEQIQTLIQPSCGYCMFLEDCKNTLGFSKEHPEKMSVQLMPYTSQSIAKQLIERGFLTIEDVAKRIGNFEIGPTPEPLYPEIKYLELKAKAIIKGDILTPLQGQSYSYALPRYSDMALVFAAESDPYNDIVFVICLFLNMSVSPRSPYSHLFNTWWQIWRDALENGWDPVEIKEELDNILFNPISEEEVKNCLEALKLLNGIQIKIINEKDDVEGENINNSTQINYRFVYINQNLSEPSEEIKLAKNFIHRMFAIIELCNFIEKYVNIRISSVQGKETFIGPEMGVFYWAKDQLKNLQQMLERNLDRISQDVEISEKFNKILTWITPSDSEITHPYQHKKFYDLQIFAETAIGFPGIINYTWHEIAEKMKGLSINPLYWIPHFNYMDFHPWYRFLLEESAEKKKEYELEIKKQINYKVVVINLLRQELQKSARQTIAKGSHPMKIKDYVYSPIKPNIHPIARLWYFYSKMSGSLDEMDQEFFRTTYPEFSIAKLVAAEVSKMKITAILLPTKKYVYSFFLLGLSRNMKISENDRVLLIPDEKRELTMGSWTRLFIITIESITWDNQENGFKIVSEPASLDLSEQFQQEFNRNFTTTRWFLYPTTNDPWTKKLIGDNGLLGRKNFGNSWLGFRLAALWGIRLNVPLTWPENLIVNMPEVYLYFPQLLYSNRNTSDSNKTTKVERELSLLTTAYPPPDASQAKAIDAALNSNIFAIQGPPGTGKSQTIAALVDEFLLRSKKPVRILITAFSYAALFVLIDKIRKSRDSNQKPTKAAQTQMVYIHTPDREPISSIKDCRDVDDVLRVGDTWKWNGMGKTLTNKKRLEHLLESAVIIFANAHQLYFLNDRVEEDFSFDLILVDEASQLPIDHFMASLQFVKNYEVELHPQHGIFKPNAEIIDLKQLDSFMIQTKAQSTLQLEELTLTKVIVVGDHNQLPPVQNLTPPKKIERILESLFSYYVKYHQIPSTQLQVNYRSHQDIVNYTAELGIYHMLEAFVKNATRVLPITTNNKMASWLKEILDPQKIVISILHQRNFEVAVSSFEAELVTKIILAYYELISPRDETEEVSFWEEKVGIVAPHNAQGRLIIHQLFREFNNNIQYKIHLSPTHLMELLKKTIYSVEKFQGSDRDLIVASIGISDLDQLQAEAEFIYDLNRFNVLTSRAKSKIIFIANMNFLNYIPDKVAIMEEAELIRHYTVDYCNNQKILFPENEIGLIEPVYLRWRDQKLKTTIPTSTYRIEYENLDDQGVDVIYRDISEIFEFLNRIPMKNFNSSNILENNPIKVRVSWDQFDILKKQIPLPKELNEYYQKNFNQKNKPELINTSNPKKNTKIRPKLNLEFGDDEQALF